MLEISVMRIMHQYNFRFSSNFCIFEMEKLNFVHMTDSKCNFGSNSKTVLRQFVFIIIRYGIMKIRQLCMWWLYEKSTKSTKFQRSIFGYERHVPCLSIRINPKCHFMMYVHEFSELQKHYTNRVQYGFLQIFFLFRLNLSTTNSRARAQ